MNDKLSASWVLVVGAVFVAYWYARIRPKSKPGGSEGAAIDTSASRETIGGGGSVLDRLKSLAQSFGAPITSTTGGQHAANSLHYAGRAIDVGTRTLSERIQQQLIDAAEAAGFRVLDERYTGPGKYGPSTGPHLHIDLPFQRSDNPVDIDNQMAREVG